MPAAVATTDRVRPTATSGLTSSNPIRRSRLVSAAEHASGMHAAGAAARAGSLARSSSGLQAAGARSAAGSFSTPAQLSESPNTSR